MRAMTPDDEDEPGFERFDGTDEAVRELRAQVVRLEAQLDQLTAEYREQRAEMEALERRIEELARTLADLMARRHRRDSPLFFVWAVVWGAVGATLANLLILFR